MSIKKTLSLLIACLLVFSLLPTVGFATETSSDKDTIESLLNLANNADQAWSYDSANDAWVLSIVSAVAYPELPDQEGVSVATPGAYVTGIDTNGDGVSDVTAQTYTAEVKGSLVIDYAATVTSPNGQTYTAATAPVILTTGAAGYGSANNSTASTSYAEDGYISVACGNRGKQDTTASASGGTDSSMYTTYDEMAAAYAADIAEIEAGDEYGNNLVSLYNPLNYIGSEGTDNPTWTRIVMGAVEGDMPMMASLDLEIAWLNAGVDAEIEWQWDGGHVPSEVLGSSLALYVDEMYGKHVSGVTTEKAAAETQTTNGTATEATGTDLSSWVNDDDVTNISFSLANVLAYRNTGASKAVPGFDVIDYGQEDYVFGSDTQDARHWDIFMNNILQNTEYAKVLSALFNASTSN